MGQRPNDQNCRRSCVLTWPSRLILSTSDTKEQDQTEWIVVLSRASEYALKRAGFLPTSPLHRHEARRVRDVRLHACTVLLSCFALFVQTLRTSKCVSVCPISELSTIATRRVRAGRSAQRLGPDLPRVVRGTGEEKKRCSARKKEVATRRKGGRVP
jgi:ferredoxin